MLLLCAKFVPALLREAGTEAPQTSYFYELVVLSMLTFTFVNAISSADVSRIC